MGLSLEHTTHILPPASCSAIEQRSNDALLHTIRGTPLNAANRFYDKPFTLIVDPSARAGATGEHSPCDALVPSIVAEYAIVQGVDASAFHDTMSSIGAGWGRLEWDTDVKISQECIAANERATKVLEDSDDSVLWFEEYGADWIKVVGRCWFFGTLKMLIAVHSWVLS